MYFPQRRISHLNTLPRESIYTHKESHLQRANDIIYKPIYMGFNLLTKGNSCG